MLFSFDRGFPVDFTASISICLKGECGVPSRARINTENNIKPPVVPPKLG